tara:strand:+ start:2376 stop:3512 length:1137 start_codon:yes stop_codon:yes gene_type:complete
MRILHIITSLNRGGAENHLVKLIGRQLKSGHEVKCIYLKGNGYWRKKLSYLGVECIFVGLNHYIQIHKSFKIANIINCFDPQILHLHMPPAEIFGMIASKIAKSRPLKIITKHNDEMFGRNRLANLLCNPILNQCDGVTFISHAVEKFFIQHNCLDQKETMVTPYGIDCEDFAVNSNFDRENKLSSLGIPRKSGMVFCTIARLTQQKRVDVLLEGFSLFLDNNNSDALLLVIGDGEQRESLEKLAQKMGIQDHVVWVRYTEEISAILNSIDVFVLTSDYEGFGLVLLEAMAAERPIIATYVSAIPEIVIDKKSGLLIEPNDPKALADAMCKMLSSKQREKFGRAGKQRALTNFSNEAMSQNFEDFYVKIFKKKRMLAL